MTSIVAENEIFINMNLIPFFRVDIMVVEKCR